MTDGIRPGSLAARLSEQATVLVVEDEPDIVAFLAAYFRASGLGLEHVDPGSVAEVEEAIARHRPSCLLLDLHLRGVSGLDVYRHLRSLPDHALLPVIMVTADSRASVRDEATRGGVDGFVTKPFNVKTLFSLVQDRVASARRHAEVSASPVTADAVTGIATHSWIHERLADEINLARHTGGAVSFALVRLRSLGETNRALGFAAGDLLLRAVAERLHTDLPASAVIGRNAGDEFAVVLPSLDGERAEEALADVLDRAARAVDVEAGAIVPVQLAAGIAAFPSHGSTSDEVEMAADVALADACDRGNAVAVAR